MEVRTPILFRATWTRLDRPGNHSPFTEPCSFLPCLQLIKSSECLSHPCQSPSLWIVLGFTVLSCLQSSCAHSSLRWGKRWVSVTGPYLVCWELCDLLCSDPAERISCAAALMDQSWERWWQSGLWPDGTINECPLSLSVKWGPCQKPVWSWWQDKIAFEKCSQTWHGGMSL